MGTSGQKGVLHVPAFIADHPVTHLHGVCRKRQNRTVLGWPVEPDPDAVVRTEQLALHGDRFVSFA